MSKDYDEAIANHKEYLERRSENLGRREEHDKSKAEISKRFDQAMLTLTAGALALSVSFVKEIAPHPNPKTVGYLYAAWACFASAIGLVITAYRVSIKAIETEITQIDIDISEDSRNLLGDTSLSPSAVAAPHWALIGLFRLKRKNLWGSFVERLNLLSMMSFGVGVVTLLIFSAKNLPEGDPMADEKPKQTTCVHPPREVEHRSLNPTGQPPRRPDPPKPTEKKGS